MIKVENLHFTYPNGINALNSVSITVQTGEFIAIMGQNGAGKTTLVKHFNGLLKPTNGTVLIDGVETTSVSVATLARTVGFVFQSSDDQLFSETVEDEVTFALKNFGFEEDVIKSRVKWALTLLHLTQYRTTSPFLLSGGERKRVAIASVLAWNPQILILDEPTIGQDYRQKERLRQLILQMNTQNKTVIIVTHDVEFVAECKPRVLLMRNGQIVADGEAKKILTNPEVLIQASILPPEIVQVFLQLPGSLQSRKIIDIYEAQETLLKILRRNGH